MADYWSSYWSQRNASGDRLRDVDCCVSGVPITREQYESWIAAPVFDLLDARPGMQVLEIGCGTGLFLEFLVARGLEPVGTDIAAGLLPECPPGLEVAAAPAARQPYPDGSFDRVVMVGVSLYFSSMEEFLDVLDEVMRLLRPGGRAVISDNLLFHTSVPPVGDTAYCIVDVSRLAQHLSGTSASWSIQSQSREKRAVNTRFDLVLELGS